MCSHHDWDRLGRRSQEAVDKGQLREFMAETLDAIDTIVDELTRRARSPEDAGWVRGCRRRSRSEWVA